MKKSPNHSRVSQLANAELHAIRVRTDRMFAGLMVLQWLGGVCAALLISPRTWVGAESMIHVNVYAAIGIGSLLASLPIAMALRFPGAASTRHVVAVAQMLFSTLFIHLSGGRIETHFHVFGSLAFLAIYRDWRVLAPATAVIALDHVLRGIFWPQSVFGVLVAAPWRAFEHAAWVLFEDIFLAYSCVQGVRDVRAEAQRRARLEELNEDVEREVRQRTVELRETIDALGREIQERHILEGQLVQAQKLESIGLLAAGIAHEINTPAQYVGDNTRFLRDQFTTIQRVIDRFEELLDVNGAAMEWQERARQVRLLHEEVDFEFLRKEIPLALDQTLEGIDRVSRIVCAMKDFSHPGTGKKEPANLNAAIESTSTVCRNRWKYVSDLELKLEPDLPLVPCHLAEINQVILNLIVNAADAIEQRFRGAGRKGLIVVRSAAQPGWVEVRVCDNGGGIPPEVQSRIFDPFFTTKEVGKGTGQGLTISRDIIVNKHGGELSVESKAGDGATFIVRLPLETTEARGEEPCVASAH